MRDLNMSINIVTPIYTAQAGITQAQKSFEKAAQSIASGTKATVSPAGLYVASGLDTSIRSSQKAIENAQTGYNFTATADSTLANVNQNLQRVRELSIQASNGVYSDEQRSAMQAEINQNVAQIQQNIAQSSFNGKQTVNAVTPDNPTPAATVDFMVGSDASSVISYDPNIAMGNMNFDVSTPEAAANSLAQVDSMISDVSAKRGDIGAVQTSFEGAIAQQTTNIQSAASSLSDIQDTDYVSAIVDMKKAQFTMEMTAKVMKAVMNSDNYVLDLLK